MPIGVGIGLGAFGGHGSGSGGGGGGGGASKFVQGLMVSLSFLTFNAMHVPDSSPLTAHDHLLTDHIVRQVYQPGSLSTHQQWRC